MPLGGGIVTRLKPDIRIAKRGGISYVVGSSGRLIRFKPWLGDSSAFPYDFVVSHSVFPRRSGGDIQKHHDILAQELAGVDGRQILELATGSGNAVHFLGRPPQGLFEGLAASARCARLTAPAGAPGSERFYVLLAHNLQPNRWGDTMSLPGSNLVREIS